LKLKLKLSAKIKGNIGDKYSEEEICNAIGPGSKGE
jgi:hypothetical protein